MVQGGAQGRVGAGARAVWAPLLLVSLPVVLLDRVSKLYALSHFSGNRPLVLIPHLLAFTYAENPGAAFSLLAGLSPLWRAALLDSASLVASVVLVLLLARAPRWWPNAFALALILGGALGNLVDRLLSGRVPDFIYVHYYGWSYPVFNFADSAITVGVALVLLAPYVRGRARKPAADTGKLCKTA